MAKVISFAIQKGGTGKTTGAYNLAWLLAEMGREVLAIDLDPQASLTEFTGTPPSAIAHSMMTGEEWQPMRPEGHNFDLVPANIDLAEAEMGLITRPTWGLTLNNAIEQLQGSYDYIIVDAPPSLGGADHQRTPRRRWGNHPGAN